MAAAAGARDVLLQAGTNDIADGATAEEVAAGLVRFADRARAAGLRVLLSTIPPSAVGSGGGAVHADGVVDLAAAVADPADPARLRPDLDSGDSLHPSPAGHRALADAVDPRVLSGSRCLAVADQARE